MNKLVFYRGRKIGGSSIDELMKYVSHARTLEMKPDADYSGTMFVSALLSPYHPMFAMQQEKVWGRTSFTVVRNPYAKIRSAYWYLRNQVRSPLFVNNSLEHCLRNMPGIKGTQNGRVGHDFHHFTISQTDWLRLNGRWLTENRLRFENLEEEVSEFLKLQGYDLTKIPHLKDGNKWSGRELNDRERELIREIFSDDFVNLGYDPDE